MILHGLSNAIRGIGGEPELNRVIGAFGGFAYVVGAHVFIAAKMIDGGGFDLTEYCLAFPGGLAVVVGSIAGAVALKDRNVAAAKATEATTTAAAGRAQEGSD